MPESTKLKISAPWGGISQQPPHQRYLNQVGDSENFVFSVADGAKKRAGTTHVASYLWLDDEGDYKFHAISRDDVEKYLVLLGAETIRVFETSDGREATVNISTLATEYMTNNLPATSQLRLVSVADYTLILNTTVAASTKNSGDDLDETTMPIKMVRSAISTPDAPAVFDVDVIEWTPRNPSDYSIQGTYDASTNTPDLDESPSGVLEKHAYTVTVKGSFYDKSVSVGDIIMADTDDPSSITGWTIIHIDDNNDTNSAPSLVTNNRKISDIAFHRNRLVLAGDENVIFSQAGDFFNFFLDDHENIVDSDPIDIALSSEQVTIIDYVVPFRKSLLIFTKAGRQFELNAPEVLTPSTAAITPSTSYKSLSHRPYPMGNMIYFPGQRGGFAAVYEYYYDDSQITNTAADITAHVPRLLEQDIRSITASSNNNILMVLSKQEPELNQLVTEDDDPLLFETGQEFYIDESPLSGKTIYVYKQFWSGTKKEQSAWGKFTFNEDWRISDISIIDSECFLLINQIDVNNGTNRWSIHKLSLADEIPEHPLQHNLHIDSKVLVVGWYHYSPWPYVNKTTWVVPTGVKNPCVIYGPDWGVLAGTVVPDVYFSIESFQIGDGTYLEARVIGTDLSEYNMYIGEKIQASMTLSRQYRRDHNGQADLEGWLQYRRITTSHQNAGDYTLRATMPRRTDRTKTFSPGVNDVEQTGNMQARFNGNAEDMVIKIESDSHKPLTITGIEIEADYVSRRNR